MELNKDSNVVFIVPSAIAIKGSDIHERVADTLSTFNSINNKFHNCKIILLECSLTKLDKSITSLFPENVEIFSLHDDPHVLKFSVVAKYYGKSMSTKLILKDGSSIEHDAYLRYIKNMTESYAIKTLLHSLDLSNYDRIFKLSGRYSLQPNFNIKEHDVPKFVTLQSIKSNQSSIPIERLHFCYIWSCPGTDFEKLKDFFVKVESSIAARLNALKLHDMEHAFYENLSDEWKHENENGKIFAKISGDRVMIR